MGDRKESDYPRAIKQQVERKKSFVDWMNVIKPPNEEKYCWGGPGRVTTAIQVCRRTGDPNKFKFCRRCDAAYHCYCMQPPHKNISSGPYLCPNHTRCHICDSNVPGNGLSLRYFCSPVALMLHAVNIESPGGEDHGAKM